MRRNSHRSFEWRVVGFVSLMVVCLYCFLAEPVDGQDEPPTITIRVALTSGLPNPTWEVQDPNEMKNLRELLRGLPESEPFEEPQFGSFILTASDEAKCRFPKSVVVFRGDIKVTTANGVTKFFKDTKGLEDHLNEELMQRGMLQDLLSVGQEPS